MKITMKSIVLSAAIFAFVSHIEGQIDSHETSPIPQEISDDLYSLENTPQNSLDLDGSASSSSTSSGCGGTATATANASSGTTTSTNSFLYTRNVNVSDIQNIPAPLTPFDPYFVFDGTALIGGTDISQLDTTTVKFNTAGSYQVTFVGYSYFDETGTFNDLVDSNYVPARINFEINGSESNPRVLLRLRGGVVVLDGILTVASGDTLRIMVGNGKTFEPDLHNSASLKIVRLS